MKFAAFPITATVLLWFCQGGVSGESIPMKTGPHRDVEIKPLTDGNFVARVPNPAERAADAEAYLLYLRGNYPNQITEVSVGLEVIRIRGRAAEPGVLQEILPHEASHLPSGTPAPGEVVAGDFETSLPRFVGEEKRDRALSRWRMDHQDGRIASLCRWPDHVEPGIAADLLNLTAPHPKGLAGVPSIANGGHEIFELGIRHATVNLVVSSLISSSKKPGFEPFLFEGCEWFLNAGYLGQTERTVQQLCAKEIIVSGILLVGNHAGSPMTHPEAEPRGIYSIPNLAEPEGTAHYRAAMHLLA